jgi:Flp pilus assembly protein TadB
LAIVLSVLLRFTDSDYPFGIFKLFLKKHFYFGTTQWPKEKRQKDRQHNGQKKKDKRTDNTMAKRKRQKDRQHNGQKKKAKGQTTQWQKEKRQKVAIVLSVLLSFFFWPLCCLSCCLFSFGHCVVCPFVFFLFAIVLSVLLSFFFKGKRTDNTMAKRKKTKGQTTQWPKEKRQKDRQHNGQKKKDNRTDNAMAKRKKQKDRQRLSFCLFSFRHCVVCPFAFFFWPLRCLSCCLFSFGHCVVCPFVFFLLVDNTMAKRKRQKDRQHNGQKKKDKRADNTMAKRKTPLVFSNLSNMVLFTQK